MAVSRFARLRIAAAFALLAPVASAADWYVDASYANCSSSTGSASQPFCTVQAAVQAASSGDSIHVAPGTYSGPITVDRSLTLLGTQGKAVTVLTGNSASVVLTVTSSLTVDLEGFTVQDGVSIGPGGGVVYPGTTITCADCDFRRNQDTNTFGLGGAIVVFQATAVLQRCALGNNRCALEGGAIGVFDGSLTLVDCEVHDNGVGTATQFAVSGGAIRAKNGSVVDLERTQFTNNGYSAALGSSGADGGAVSSDQSTVTAVACTFRGNDAGTESGGALEGDGIAALDCLFEGNFAHGGGAVAADGVTCERCRFVGNEVFGTLDHGGVGGVGGALMSWSGATITDCTFEGNVAHGAGNQGIGAGGAFDGDATAAAPASFTRCRFAGNRAEGSAWNGGSGGGLCVGSFTALVDCEIVGNQAGSTLAVDAGIGGGVLCSATTGLSFTRCTIAGNRADNANGTAGAGGLGGGIFGYGACDLDHCIVAGNFAQAPTTQDIAGLVDSLGWNDFGDTNGATISGPGTNDLLDVDPQFADAANGDFRLAATSPCLDSGDATLTPTGRDVAWNPRLLDGDLNGTLVVDRGAHEFSNVSLTVTGSATPGGSLTFDTSGTAGLPVLLVVGVGTSELAVKKLGALFVDLASPFVILPFGTIPNTQNVTIDPSLPVPLTAFLQEAALAPGAGNFGNLVTLDVE
jgi:hypothetical protein